MASPARLVANRRNALLSTGPRTAPGKRRSSLNALKGGLFAKHLVLAKIGESAEDLNSFRHAIVASLGPVGATERACAERIALLLWRQRRAARYEAATAGARMASIPPDPAEVTGEGANLLVSLSLCATTAERLTRVRAILRMPPARVEELRGAAQALVAPGDTSIPTNVAWAALAAATAVFGWRDSPNPWIEVLRGPHGEREPIRDIRWDAGTLRSVLNETAEALERASDEELDWELNSLFSAMRDRLLSACPPQDLAELQTQEKVLAERLQEEHDQAAGGAIYCDEKAVVTVARAEANLSRELDRALKAFAQLRALRGDKTDPGELGSFSYSRS